MTSIKRTIAESADTANVTSKVFIRSTKSGRVSKVVREIYLRTDIPCSSRLCVPCDINAPVDSSGNKKPFVLSDEPACTSKYPKGHYIIPDTNIFLLCMDVLEHSSAFYDVIVLQTVLDELKAQSLPLYNRVLALTRSEDKRFYVFHNEFRQETHVRRLPEETINDRNDRAIRKAASWYKSHLADAVAGTTNRLPAIVLLTNDKDNLKKAKGEGVECCSIREYIEGLKNKDELLDMLSASVEDSITEGTAEKAHNVYPEYYSLSKMNTGVRDGTLHQGMFNVSVYNALEGVVNSKAFSKPLLILGRESMNRAVQGDQVVVQILPKDQWRRPSDKIVDQDTISKNDSADVDQPEAIVTERERRALIDEAKRMHAGTSDEERLQPTAKVVGVMRRGWRSYVGNIDPNSVNQAKAANALQTLFLQPLDKRIPRIRIKTRQTAQLLGKRIVVNIDEWEPTSRYPVGHFVRELGELETKEAETEALLLEFDVQYQPFSKSVLDCLPAEGHDWKVPNDLHDSGWVARKDLRHLLICSIDPPGCQDIDDALHATALPNGNYQVGVHIADVSHFVKPGTPMDQEAAARGTTVYLVDKRIDMLPPLLGTDLCSLKPYVERYAFSVIWEMTPDAKIISTECTKSVIRSREAFAYEKAQIRIDDKTKQDDLTKGMRILLALSKKLRQARMDAGALNLASPEVKVHTESETSDPMEVEVKKLLETNSLVEEFMLCANISVARKIYEAFPVTAMLRRHGAPPAANFDDLRNQLKVRKGLDLSVTSSKALADSLDACVDPNDPFFNTLIRILATRCMLPAEYFCSSTYAYPEFRHYGLASDIYTHFTSPIRRYADLAVHRQLAAAIEYEAADESLHSKNKLEMVCRNINRRHRNAQYAGRASVDYYVGQALKGKTSIEEGFVMRVFSNGIVAFVPRFGVEGTIPLEVEVFDGEKYEVDILFGKKDKGKDEEKKKVKRKLGLFDAVKVQVDVVQEEATGRRKVKLELV